MSTPLLYLFAAAAAVIAYQAISFLSRFLKTHSSESLWCFGFALVSALYAMAFIPLYTVEGPEMSVVIRLVMLAGIITLGLYLRCMLTYFDSRSRLLSLGSSIILLIGALYAAMVVFDIVTGSNLLIAPKPEVGRVRSMLLPNYFVNHYDILWPTRYLHATCRLIALASLIYLLISADMKRDRLIQLGVVVSIACLIHNMITVSWAVTFFAPLLPFMNLIEITRLEWRARRGEELRLVSYQQRIESFQHGLNEHLKLKKIGEEAAKFIHDAINIAFITNTKLSSAKHEAEKIEDHDLIRDITIASENNNRLLNMLTSGRENYLMENPAEAFDAEEAIDGALELTDHRLRSNGIKLIFEGVSTHKIMSDRTKLTQVFVNLFNNACDAVVKSPDRWIRIDIHEQDEQTIVAVTNSGEKISRELEDKIFSPFFTTKGEEGTGLGLKICKDNLAATGGDLVLNTDGMYTRFDVVLPHA